MDANKMWLSIPKETRGRLLNNVWCGHCAGATKIVHFIVESEKVGIVLKGKCEKCGNDVARVVEMD